MQRLFLTALFCCLTISIQAQVESYRLEIKRAVDEIELDGKLEEEAWQKAAVAKEFYQSFPFDTAYAATKTEVKMTYDDRFIYVGAICYDELEGDYVVQSLKRDFSFPVNDAFAIFVDPFQDQTNGFSFSVNPVGAQREGLLTNGGFYGVTTSWDNKWFSEVSNEEDYWVVEMAIPFKSVRFKEGAKQWNINFGRNDLKRIERSAWVPIPRQFNIANLAFTAVLEWDEAPRKNGSNIALIPYTTVGIKQTELSNGTSQVDLDIDGGLDARIALTSSLNLDLTVNPDFSQVEVDRQVINLDRFEIFFPERRPFFMENSDMFSAGPSNARPFFSRRVGLGNPISLGLKLSGNINKNWRVGLLNVQTADENSYFDNGQNYSMVSVQRKLLDRSYVKAFLVNRQALNEDGIGKGDYNRVAGGEFSYQAKDGKLNANLRVNASFDPDEEYPAALVIANVEYSGRLFYGFNSVEYIEQEFRADAGYVPELFHRDATDGTTFTRPVYAIRQIAAYKFYRDQSDLVNYYEARYDHKPFWNVDSLSISLRDWAPKATLSAVFRDNSQLKLSHTYNRNELLAPLSFLGNLLDKGVYHYHLTNLDFSLHEQHRMNGSFGVFYGGLFNGNRRGFNTDLTYRVQPWGNFSLNVAFNDIDFPDAMLDARYWLIGPRVELSFTKDIYFSTFFQYNTQADNFNINSRFQWRYRPMSDLFIVYTDNFTADDLLHKNRGVILKLNYWLSL